MKTHGWTKTRNIVSVGFLAILLSGCQTVPFGAQHPFSTMFQHKEPMELTAWSSDESQPVVALRTTEVQTTEVRTASHSVAVGY